MLREIICQTSWILSKELACIMHTTYTMLSILAAAVYPLIIVFVQKILYLIIEETNSDYMTNTFYRKDKKQIFMFQPEIQLYLKILCVQYMFCSRLRSVIPCTAQMMKGSR